MFESKCKLLPAFDELVTRRYILSEGILNPLGATTNVGIASYACETICGSARLGGVNSYCSSLAKELACEIAAQAISRNGVTLWGWEKKPIRADYRYPADWDDTCKAIDAIIAFESRYGEGIEVSLPSATDLELLLLGSVFHAPSVGHSVLVPCKNTLALYMFMADRDEKPNNTEDVMVTAVTVHCLLTHYGDKLNAVHAVLHDLAIRLVEVAEHGLSAGIAFSQLSRCYYSWAHFLIVLDRVGRFFGDVEKRIRPIIERFLRLLQWEYAFSSELPMKFFVQDEVHYSHLLAKQAFDLDMRCKSSAVEHAAETVQIMYQHRRLGHYYGSVGWSKILKNLANDEWREEAEACSHYELSSHSNVY